MVKSVFQIEIPKRTTICHSCQQPLNPGSEIFSALKEGQIEGAYDRQDFCLSCWNKPSAQDSNSTVQSLWKSKIPLKKPVSDLPKQRDARALCLLKAALNSSEPDDQAEAFILALYLGRRRLLYFRQDLVLEDGQAACICEIAETEEMLCIRKISLSNLQVEKVQQQLAKKFKA